MSLIERFISSARYSQILAALEQVKDSTISNKDTKAQRERVWYVGVTANRST
jgi:hypothetical protein